MIAPTQFSGLFPHCRTRGTRWPFLHQRIKTIRPDSFFRMIATTCNSDLFICKPSHWFIVSSISDIVAVEQQSAERVVAVIAAVVCVPDVQRHATFDDAGFIFALSQRHGIAVHAVAVADVVAGGVDEAETGRWSMFSSSSMQCIVLRALTRRRSRRWFAVVRVHCSRSCNVERASRLAIRRRRRQQRRGERRQSSSATSVR